MAIVIDEKAPDFTLKSKNLTGEVKDVKLSDYRGKNVVLFFFPQAFTGVCTKEMCTVSDDVKSYDDMNTVTLGISVDSVFTLEAFAKQNNIKIPLLSDFNREVTDKYGVRFGDNEFAHGMKGVSKRAVFVIDKEGILRYTETTESAGNLPDFEKVKEALNSLN